MELNYQVHDWVSRPYLISESKNAMAHPSTGVILNNLSGP